MEKQASPKTLINNAFYDVLEEQWYEAQNHPVALLRAENTVRNPWVEKEIETRLGKNQKILDIGCGAGLLTNLLSSSGHRVTGIDLSSSSLEVAKRHDETQRVHYVQADAYALPFEEGSFDAVCAMDILEHVEHPDQLVREASRVLRKGGLFFFHTFNRNILSYFLVIKGVEWFVKNTPPHLHVYPLFIKPSELKEICTREHLSVEFLVGLNPVVWCRPFWKMVWTREVPADFRFAFVKSLYSGYCGIAVKT